MTCRFLVLCPGLAARPYLPALPGLEGFDFPHRGDSALAVPAAKREAVFEELWEHGGLAFWAGNSTDVLVDERANRLAYEFWRSRTLPRIPDRTWPSCSPRRSRPTPSG